jgi:hypothetical protein
MKWIAIYVEGGGDNKDQRAQLRIGLDQLLNSQKKAAGDKRLSLKLVPSGSRKESHEAFIDAIRRPNTETLCVLLVDSEDPIAPEAKEADVSAIARKQHLQNRDGWDLKNVEPNRVHLMVQCMEAWILADPEALEKYYGKGFRKKSLPTRQNLEDEPKADVYDKIAKATKQTSKGEYSKISHASALLARIDPKKIAARCPRFATFTSWLDKQIKKA